MLDVAFSIIFIFFILTLIGSGFSSLISNSLETILIISPTVGLILITIIGTYLVFFDFPISIWSAFLTSIGIFFSLLIFYFRINKISFGIDKNKLGIFFLGLIFTSVLIFGPMVIGGLDFTILRGNGADTFNYIIMAGALQHEPYSFFQSAPLTSLIDKHPTYLIAKILLSTRWSTSVILGWCSTLTHIPLQRIEYGFTCLFFLISYGLIFQLLNYVPLKTKYVFLTTIGLSVGFWSQFVLDLRAMGQISAYPLLIFLTLIIARIENDGPKYSWGIVLGITLSAIGLLYIEYFFLIFFGLLLFFVSGVIQKKMTFKSILLKYRLSVLISVIILAPIFYHYLFHFFTSQVSFALTTKIHWEGVYFKWLYKNFLFGIWGLYIWANSDYQIMKFLIGILASILSIVFLFLMYTVIRIKNNISITASILTHFLAATFLIFGCLFIQDQRWAAGKALIFGYPFLILFMASHVFGLLLRTKNNPFLVKMAMWTVCGWLVIQILLGVHRVILVMNNKCYSHYLAFHGAYRQHDWNVNNITEFLKKNKIQTVGLLVPDNWMSEYLDLVWGWEMKLIHVNGIPQRDGTTFVKQSFTTNPQYLILNCDKIDTNQTILARNKELILVVK